MTTPKTGDTVRYTWSVTGKVTSTDPGWITVFADRHAEVYQFSTQDSDAIIEVIQPPEPKWQAGDMVLDNHGRFYKHRCPTMPSYDKYPWTDDVGTYTSEAMLYRPLVRLGVVT